VVLDTSRARALLGRYPVIAVAPVAWLWVLADRVDGIAYGVSVVLLVVSLVIETVRARQRRRGAFSGMPSALAFLAAVGALRQAGGGLSSGVGALTLVPVFQVALFGRDRRELWLMLAAETALYLAPILLVGGTRYPETQYRAGVIFVLVSGVVALAGRRLVGRVRREAADARASRRMIEEVTALVHELFASPDVRGDLSAGTLHIAGASLAVLLEPGDRVGVLSASAIAGLSLDALELPIDPHSAVGGALVSGRPSFVSHVEERALSAPAIWRACGRPDSVLYQPLMRGGRPIGVFVVAWQDGDAVTSARLSAVELLAHEAGLVLDRADQVTQLTGMAQTDPLTGLPNRRAWDGHVDAALRDGRGITVALLDIDHFKAYNDAHGHPAGDRLLRESAAAWRDLLRAGDLLARLGGEEFGVLLLDCAPSMVIEVTERLRAATAGGRTCSAGLATRRPGEPFESVVARADHALYEAKAAGRDVARAAV
jgi:diguanylate cyclase (GGDEF)-like protein